MPTRASTTPKSRPTRSSTSTPTTTTSRRAPAKRTPTSAAKRTTKNSTPSSAKSGVKKEIVYLDAPTTEEEESSSEDSAGDVFDPGEEDEGDEPLLEADMDEDEEDEGMDSDDLDDEKPKKRKSTGGGGGSSKKKPKTSDRKPNLTTAADDSSDDDAALSDVSLESGQAIASRIYPAPTTGLVAPGLISANTFKFLTHLQNPKKNDRDWFRSHEPAYRVAEKEWVGFVNKWVGVMRRVDGELPALPAKDVIQRIYRDVRFSTDKTPYKTHFSASNSRSGRKGIWAGYFVKIEPGGGSLIAGGVWGPGREELASIRHQILTNPHLLKSTLSAPAFTALFGPPHPLTKSAASKQRSPRQSVFGHDDALKVAPKGVDKGHPDIELLKLRSVAVVHRFTDEEVLAEGFLDRIAEVVAVMRPLVHCLNTYLAIPAPSS